MELVAVGRDPAYFDSGTLLSHLCLVWGSGALGLYYVGQRTQNPFPVLCIIRISGRIGYLIKWIVTEECLEPLGKPQNRNNDTSLIRLINKNKLPFLGVWIQVGLRKHHYDKASGGDGIPAKLFKILRDDAVKVLHSICQQIWKTLQWPQNWKMSICIPTTRKGNAKECSNDHTLCSFHLLAR